jgi:hypothetical protein
MKRVPVKVIMMQHANARQQTHSTSTGSSSFILLCKNSGPFRITIIVKSILLVLKLSKIDKETLASMKS